jgi:hypothetical protein
MPRQKYQQLDTFRFVIYWEWMAAPVPALPAE